MRLDANVTGNMASDITVEWVRQDGRTMPSKNIQRDATLYIENADYEDGGVYVCRGRNSQGNVVFFLGKPCHCYSAINQIGTCDTNGESW